MQKHYESMWFKKSFCFPSLIKTATKLGGAILSLGCSQRLRKQENITT